MDANPKKKLLWPKGLFTHGQHPDWRYHLFVASTLTDISVTFKRLIKIPRALRRGKKVNVGQLVKQKGPLPPLFHFRIPGA